MADVVERLKAALADRYRLERELGAGGMATVYLARDLRHDREVAIKVLRPELAATLGPQRFLQEIQIAARLTHPHILPLHDSGQADGFLYYVMPYVEGESLRDKLSREGELPVAEAVRILKEVTDALAYAHGRGVVHRDIKPENVMLSGRHALVTDFGVAKALHEATGRQQLTTAGVALGTPAYMAPEQAAADPHMDHRADLYAVGAMGYELLTGRPPFTGASPQMVLAAHVTEPPRPVTDHRPAVPAAMAGTIMRCLEKKPADRWQTAGELLAQLEVLASTPSGGMTPTATQPITAVAPPAAGVSRRGWPLMLGGLAAVVAIAVAGWYWVSRPVALVPTRVAVLPFENKTGDATLEDRGIRLAEALTEAIGREGVGEPVAAATIRNLTVAGGDQAALTRRVADRTGAGLVLSGAYYRAQAGVEVRVEVLRLPAMEQRFAFSVAGNPASDSLLGAVTERALVALTLEKEWGPGVSWQGEYLPRSMTAVRAFLLSMELRTRGDTAWGAAAHEAYAADSAWIYGLGQALGADYAGPWEPARQAARAAMADFERRRSPTQGDRERLTLWRAWLAGDLEGRYQAMKQLFARRPSEYGADLVGEAYLTRRFRQAVELRPWLDAEGFGNAPSRRTVDAHNAVGTALHLLGRYQEEGDLGREMRREFPNNAIAGINHEMRGAIGLGDTAAANRLVDELERYQPKPGEGWSSSRALIAALELHAHGYRANAAVMSERAIRGLEEGMARGDTTLQALTDLANALLYLGRHEELSHLVPRFAVRGDSLSAHVFLGYVATMRGDRAGVARADERLARMHPENPYAQGGVLFSRAEIAARSGDHARAIDLLRAAAQSGFGEYLYCHQDPDWDALRDTPAFKELTRPRE